jgi:Crp-like helix-turn-helix domain
MEYGVYLESSIVDLKPRVLDFLSKMVEKAKDARDFAITFKKKEIAELAGKDTRTVSRYLNELEERNIIQTRGVRGRSGGTVVLFNTELIRFDTSEKALINSDKPITIDDVVEQKMPKKKPEEPKKNKRNRRTKMQMAAEKALRGEKQAKHDKLNSQLHKLGGVPNWTWFEQTENPVGNYRTYLLTRMYNRYAVLFTDRHNGEVDYYQQGNKLPVVTNDYDVLPADFFGSSKWQQFEKFRLFCEENNIEPTVYLSAQFSRSVFVAASKNTKKMLPFPNALMSDASYNVYKDYVGYQKKVSYAYAVHSHIPNQFGDDFVIQAILDAYETADSSVGLLQYRHSIGDFLTGVGGSDMEYNLVSFYRNIEYDLHESGVSKKTRDTIKKFVLLQSMIQTGGITRLPGHLILGSEHMQIVLASLKNLCNTPDQLDALTNRAIGLLLLPMSSEEEQRSKGGLYKYQLNVLDETRKVLALIMERKGLHISLADLNEAFREYGKEKIPLNDLSVMDVDQISKFIEEQEQREKAAEIDHAAITQTTEWKLEGAVFDDDSLAAAIAEAEEEIRNAK